MKNVILTTLLFGTCGLLQFSVVETLQQPEFFNNIFGNSSLNSSASVTRSSRAMLRLHTSQEFANFVKLHENCSRNSWYCFPQCRIRRSNTSAVRCSQPAPDAECFGVNITHLYVPPDPYVLSLLPRYEVLSRFPRCWSVLAPLICAVTYRPCTVRYAMQSFNPNVEKLELWQLFRWDMCDRAMRECPFLLEWGLWPDFLNCSGESSVKNVPKLYADQSCPIGYREDPASFDRLQCLWPLVKSDEVYRDKKPVIDDCYMPCFSSLISSISTRADFKTKVLVTSTTIGIILLLICIYVIGFSEVWRKNLCAYILGHTSFSGFLYYLFWILGFFDEVSKSAMCFDNGNLRRGNDDTLGKTIGWCGIQSFLMQSMFFSAYFWLCTFFVVSIGRPRIRADHKILIDGHPDWSLRCVLLVLYLIAAIVALPPFWSSKSENDGLLGVCYIGLVIGNDRLWIFLPVLLATIIASLITAKILMTQKGSGSSDEDVRKNCESVTVDSRGTCFKDTGNTPSTEAGVVVGCCRGTVSGEEPADGAFASVQISETAENEELIPDSCGTVRLSKRGIVSECYDNGATAVPPIFLGLLVLVYIFSLVLLLLVHFRNDWSSEFEDEMILKSFRCTLNQTVVNGKTKWFEDAQRNDKLSSSVDPMVRKRLIGSRNLNAPGCDLQPKLDEHFYTLFLLYIIVPSLPFLVVFVMLISGFCGTGFEGIEKIREQLNPFVRIISSVSSSLNEEKGKNEVEMEGLAGYSSQNCATRWCNNDELLKRPFSSVDGLNKLSGLSSAASIPSQINSEPIKPNKSKYHVRKLDLKRLAQCRARNAKKNLSLQSTGGSSCSEQLGMLSSQHCSFASLPSEVPSIYSHVSSNHPGSYNIESVSQRRDSNIERGTTWPQSQTIMTQNLWQQMCHEYSSKVNTLVGCLRQAEDEIRRLTGQHHVNEFSTLSTMVSPPLHNCYCGNAPQFVNQPLLQPSNPVQISQNVSAVPSNCVANDQCQTSNVCRCTANHSITGSGGDRELLTSVSRLPESFSHSSSASVAACSTSLVDNCNSPVNSSVTPATRRDNDTKDSKSQLLKSVGDGESNGNNSTDDSPYEKSDDSNSFLSDEEDEEEEKLWKEQSSNMLQNEQSLASGRSASDKSVVTQEVKQSNEALSMSSSSSPQQNPNCQTYDSDGRGNGRRIQHYLLPSLKPPGRSAEVASNLQRRHGVVNTNSGVVSVNATPAGVTNSSHTIAVVSTEQIPSTSHPQGPVRRQLFGNSLPLAAVADRNSGSIINHPESSHSSPASPNGIRPVLLTEEQARGLLNLRDQLTGNDLLYYSNRLREEAMRRLGAQVPNGQRRIRRITENANRQAEPIREEEEEVPDPFSSSEGPSGSSSLPNESSSTNSRTDNNRDNGSGTSNGVA